MTKAITHALHCETLILVSHCSIEVIPQAPLKKMPELQQEGLAEEGIHEKLRCSSNLHGKACRTLCYESSVTFCEIQCGTSTELL